MSEDSARVFGAGENRWIVKDTRLVQMSLNTDWEYYGAVDRFLKVRCLVIAARNLHGITATLFAKGNKYMHTENLGIIFVVEGSALVFGRRGDMHRKRWHERFFSFRRPHFERFAVMPRPFLFSCVYVDKFGSDLVEVTQRFILRKILRPVSRFFVTVVAYSFCLSHLCAVAMNNMLSRVLTFPFVYSRIRSVARILVRLSIFPFCRSHLVIYTVWHIFIRLLLSSLGCSHSRSVVHNSTPSPTA